MHPSFNRSQSADLAFGFSSSRGSSRGSPRASSSRTQQMAIPLAEGLSQRFDNTRHYVASPMLGSSINRPVSPIQPLLSEAQISPASSGRASPTMEMFPFTASPASATHSRSSSLASNVSFNGALFRKQRNSGRPKQPPSTPELGFHGPQVAGFSAGAPTTMSSTSIAVAAIESPVSRFGGHTPTGTPASSCAGSMGTPAPISASPSPMNGAPGSAVGSGKLVFPFHVKVRGGAHSRRTGSADSNVSVDSSTGSSTAGHGHHGHLALASSTGLGSLSAKGTPTPHSSPATGAMSTAPYEAQLAAISLAHPASTTGVGPSSTNPMPISTSAAASAASSQQPSQQQQQPQPPHLSVPASAAAHHILHRSTAGTRSSRRGSRDSSHSRTHSRTHSRSHSRNSSSGSLTVTLVRTNSSAGGGNGGSGYASDPDIGGSSIAHEQHASSVSDAVLNRHVRTAMRAFKLQQEVSLSLGQQQHAGMA